MRFRASNLLRTPFFLNRKTDKRIRRKLGLTSKNKFMRQVKRSLKDLFSSSTPVSATSVGSSDGYRYQGRTLSQLTGGV